MSPPRFDIFLIFPNFLRSQVLSRSATRAPGLLYYMSSVVLFMTIRTCTKLLQSSKILCPVL